MVCTAQRHPVMMLPSNHIAESDGIAGTGTYAKRSRSNSEETAMILTSLSRADFGRKEGEQVKTFLKEKKSRTYSYMTSDVGRFDDVETSRKLKAEGSKAYVNSEGAQNKTSMTKHISLEELRAHFDRPIIDVAKDFGICITLMKKICRRNGIKRWPHRQIRSLSKSIASLEAAMLSAQGVEREKYRDQILTLQARRDSVIANPNKENMSHIRGAGRLSHAIATAKSVAYQQSLLITRTEDSSDLASPTTPSNFQDAGSPAAENASTSPLSPDVAATLIGNLAHVSSSPSSNGVEKQGIIKGEVQRVSQHSKGGRWTSEEHAAFLEGIRCYGKNWRRVAQVVKTRNAVQTRTHAQKYLLKFASKYNAVHDMNLVAKQVLSIASGQSPLSLHLIASGTSDESAASPDTTHGSL